MIDMTLAELLSGLDLSADDPPFPTLSQVHRMTKITIYRVEFYDIRNDVTQRSTRWWTREGAEAFHGHVVKGSALEVDASCLEPGEQWTPRGYDPHATKGPQTQVR